ncbi:tRNA glutamyl-Q(34) synthetase GluQRS [Sphingomonas sp.]|uniref:tRNA glutamyl-Q(34) synthetase GluQRS n=1 Tax=Sphingomonas sp. TaxID=28214 RepID=UPI001B19EAC5|nr:tRNA glutamyl-Q(34) synthetase GluQRS [Sphingomonas sp.]MBO9713031.1 tRNA glutamyl-Q(34) synthetase GluQRS [Sphingomonas sp.]
MKVVTRFAPSPTGRLHLGHAWSAIQAHAFARATGGDFLLRIEDIDGTRSRPEHVEAIVADLEWLGLDWDGEIVFQSQRLRLYEQALDRLRAMGLLYPCFCTRSDIAASASAPHGPDGVLYPGTCRGLEAPDLSKPHAWRLDVQKALGRLPILNRHPGESRDDAGISETRDSGLLFHDSFAGPTIADPASLGDVVLARKDAPASYHLAVTVDDAAQGVTNVVRGRDLFHATHIHRLLQALLGLPNPAYTHHALLAGPDGARLAKRHGAPTLEAMRLDGLDGETLGQLLREGRLPVGIGLATD